MPIDVSAKPHPATRDWLLWMATLGAAAWLAHVAIQLWLVPDPPGDLADASFEAIETWRHQLALSRWSGPLADLGAGVAFVVGFARLAKIVPTGKQAQLATLTALAGVGHHGLGVYLAGASVVSPQEMFAPLHLVRAGLDVVAVGGAAAVVHRLLGSQVARGVRVLAAAAVAGSLLLVVPNVLLLDGDPGGVWVETLGPFRVWTWAYLASKLALIATLGWAGWPRPMRSEFSGYGLEGARGLLWVRLGFALLSGLVLLGVGLQARDGGLSERLVGAVLWVGHIETVVSMAFIAALATGVCAAGMPTWIRGLSALGVSALWFRASVSGGLVVSTHVSRAADVSSALPDMVQVSAMWEPTLRVVGLVGVVLVVAGLSVLPRTPGRTGKGHVAKLLAASVVTGGAATGVLHNPQALGALTSILGLVVFAGALWVLVLFSALLRAVAEGALLPPEPSGSNSSQAVSTTATASESRSGPR